MTKSQINKLGKKLQTTIVLDSEAMSQLQHFRASYDEPMFQAQLLLQELGFKATSRLKTINTIVEKLRRERTRLAEMQDVGGLRIVLKVDLDGQDEIVGRILEAFPNAKVIDRRKTPKYGYRAVHVIAVIDQRRIEIQIRTQLQDFWAQAVERLADEAGREIRYGGTPQSRIEDVQNVLNLSTEIATVENILTRLNQLRKTTQPSRTHFMQRELRLHLAHVLDFRLVMTKQAESIRAKLGAIIAPGGAS